MEMIWRVLPKCLRRAAGTARVPVLVSHWDVSQTPLSALTIVPPLSLQQREMFWWRTKELRGLACHHGFRRRKDGREKSEHWAETEAHSSLLVFLWSGPQLLLLTHDHQDPEVHIPDSQGNRDSVDLQSCRWTSLCFNLLLRCLQHLQVTREELGNPPAASSWTADTPWTFMEPNIHLSALVCIQWANPGRTGG